MTRNRVVAGAVAAVLLVLAVLVAVAARAPDRSGPRAGGPAPVPAGAVRPSGTASPTTRPSSLPPGPPAGTRSLPAATLQGVGARRVSWAAVLDAGRPLPAPSARCRRAWERSGKDAGVDWSQARFWCLDGLGGRGWRPQGVAGSATADGYRIAGRPAGARDLVLTSWYSRADEPGLLAPNRPGQSVTRLVVADLDRGRYASVELVRPVRGRLRNLNSHGSGLAWTGQYLYSSSHSWLWLYNLDDLLEVDGHLVLPAVASWSVTGHGGLSSISADPGSHQLTGVDFRRSGQAWVQSVALGADGLPRSPASPTRHPLVLTPRTGGPSAPVVSARTTAVPGGHYQGVARWHGDLLASSSSYPVDGVGRPRTDALVVLRAGRVRNAVRLPGPNVESVYLDSRRGRYVSVTGHGSSLLFAVPLAALLRS